MVARGGKTNFVERDMDGSFAEMGALANGLKTIVPVQNRFHFLKETAVKKLPFLENARQMERLRRQRRTFS